MFKVSAVPPRRSAVLTGFRGATAINDGTTAIMAVPLRFIPTSTAVASRLRCDGGISSSFSPLLIVFDAEGSFP